MTARRGLVLSPAMPQWDGGGAVAPLVHVLECHGFEPDVVDTSALTRQGDSLDVIVARISRLIDASQYSVIAGNALGGTLGMLLSASLKTPIPVMSVSGPCVTHGGLSERLSAVIRHATVGDTHDALRLLEQYVVPLGSDQAAPEDLVSLPHPWLAAQRLSTSLSSLLNIDLTGYLRDSGLRAVTLIGELSQLVTAENAFCGPSGDVVVVEGTGMRLHQEQPRALHYPLQVLTEGS